MRIYDIESPKQIKNMSIPQLVELSNDIRSFLISSISKQEDIYPAILVSWN